MSPQVDEPRGAVYRLLARLFIAPPTKDLLEALAALRIPEDSGTDTPMLAAWRSLRSAARQADLEAVDDEYHALFIGVGRGELVPYASYYLSGSMMSLPLARLRRDLARIGLARKDGVCEPEDHVSAVCEAMCLMIDSEDIPGDVQRRFFSDHVGSWMPRFCVDLRRSPAARFYAAVGEAGQAFIALEEQCLVPGREALAGGAR